MSEPHSPPADADSPPWGWAFGGFFCLMAAYYIVRPVRDAIAAGYNDRTDLFFGAFVAMLLVVPVVGWLGNRMPRDRLLARMYQAAAGMFVLFAVLTSTTTGDWIGKAFFVWISVFSYASVALFWSLQADLFRPAEAERLFSRIAAGGSCGALVGPSLTAILVRRIGAPWLLMLAAAFLLFSAACLRVLCRSRACVSEQAVAKPAPPAAGLWNGFALTIQSPTLRLISGVIILLSSTAMFLYLEQSDLAKLRFSDRTERVEFFARADLFVSGLSLFGQFLFTPWLVRRYGLTAALVVLPLGSIFGFATLAAVPGFWPTVIILGLRRAGEYAVAKPARDVLFAGLSHDEKYQAKTFIDTALARGTEFSTAALIGMIHAGHYLTSQQLSGCYVLASAATLALVLRLKRG